MCIHCTRRSLSAEKCGIFFLIDLWSNGGCRKEVETLVERNMSVTDYISSGGVSQEPCVSVSWTMNSTKTNVPQPCDHDLTVQLQMEYARSLKMAVVLKVTKGSLSDLTK